MKSFAGICVIQIILNGFINIKFGKAQVESKPVDEVAVDHDYLYHGYDSFPVIEYQPEKGVDRPSFLFDSNNSARVVEFYAPWCPHCQHFRDHYIELARQVKANLKEITNGNENDGDVSFFAVSCTANKKLCHSFGINGYPKIRLFPAGATNYTEELQYWKVHPFDVLTGLNIKFSQMRLDEITEIASEENGLQQKFNKLKNFASGTIMKSSNIAWPSRTKQQMFHDALLSFEFSMRNGIYLSEGSLSNSTKDALREWLELLQKTTPVAWSTLQTVVREVLNNFEFAVEKEENLLTILNASFNSSSNASKSNWSSACTRYVPGMGYTCGLWELFHIVSVGLVEYNLMIFLNDDDATTFEMQISDAHAAEVMRNFIEHFFGCEVCRKKFLLAFDGCVHDHCTRFNDEWASEEQWIQFPVWLFEVHNSVSVRLLHESAQRGDAKRRDGKQTSISTQDEMNKQWPGRKECPKCWTDSGSWDEEFVYKYLHTQYWVEDNKTIEYRADLGDGLVDTDNGIADTAFLFLQFAIAGLALGAIFLWQLKVVEKRRTGRHKKVDV